MIPFYIFLKSAMRYCLSVLNERRRISEEHQTLIEELSSLSKESQIAALNLTDIARVYAQNHIELNSYKLLLRAIYNNDLNIIQRIWKDQGPNPSINEINPGNKFGETLLHVAAENNRLHIMKAIWDKIGPNAKVKEINPECILKVTPLHIAAKNGNLRLIQAIYDKMGHDVDREEINPKCCRGLTPLHHAVQRGDLLVLHAIWNKMGQNLSVDNINPQNKSVSLLHYAVHFRQLAIFKEICIKLLSIGVKQICIRDRSGNTFLHYAASNGDLNFVQALLGAIKPDASIDEINPKNEKQYTPLHYAAIDDHLNVVQAILDRIGPNASFDEINPKADQGRTPLYYACGRQKHDAVHLFLDYELIEVNHVGLLNLMTYFSADTSDCNRIRDRLRQIGCLEIPEANQDPNARLVQDTQGIHASGVEKGIKNSLEKLRVGKSASVVLSSYKDFIKYCNLSNPAFVDDLRAIQVNSQNFSRNLIVKALSEIYADSEKAELERIKFTLFSDAISHQLHNMTLSSNSTDFVTSFKERIGLIWGELNNPGYWHKFTDLKEIIDIEGETFSRDNPSAEFKSALQKLRNVLFIQLIETRYEYAAGVNASSAIPSREELFDALERSGPSCAGGTNNFIIECFSHRHQDIEVLAGQFTADFTSDATLSIRIASKLYELIIASVNTRTEIQTRVDSETRTLSIEGISIINELLDRMAGASDKVKKVLPQDEILLEDRIREYFRTGSIPGHSRAIGYLLGLLKLTLQENIDIIGGLPLQPNQNREEALSAAFRHLEQALFNSQPSFLTQALTEARSQYYQQFFKNSQDEKKLLRLSSLLCETNEVNHLVNKGELELFQAALIESYGETKRYNQDTQRKVFTDDCINLIKNESWYQTLLKQIQVLEQEKSDNLKFGYELLWDLVYNTIFGKYKKQNEVLINQIDTLLGIKTRTVQFTIAKDLANSNHSDLTNEKPTAVLFSGEKQVSILNNPSKEKNNKVKSNKKAKIKHN